MNMALYFFLDEVTEDLLPGDRSASLQRLWRIKYFDRWIENTDNESRMIMMMDFLMDLQDV